MAALHYTVTKLKKPRHVTGPELLKGIREYTLEQFGLNEESIGGEFDAYRATYVHPRADALR